jgi:hypothetical protein
VIIGKKGDIWNNLDDEFWAIFNLYRWHQSKLSDIEYTKLYYPIQIGIRKLIELKQSENLVYA